MKCKVEEILEKTAEDVKFGDNLVSRNGDISINHAYQQTQEKRKHEQETTEPKTKPTFNLTNENIEWAKWSWNPVTGCKYNCPYCYAHEIALRYNSHGRGFRPTFYEYRLDMPKNTKVPKEADALIGYKNVFLCSMADLFGDWVPQKWIDRIIEKVRENPQWNFLVLTKNPKRLLTIDFPDNVWVGTTVDIQERVKPAEEVFGKLKCKVKFVSCEPLRERIIFNSLNVFDWLIVGGQRKAHKMKEFQPPWEWVEHLINQARKSNCKVYMKSNLKSRPKEYPHSWGGKKAC